ncbi:MAG TPA: hypothetical protein VHY77_02190, partial [Acidimicrobiales bacterium]|nr:hypothetical protein [Acidimicrobiales bacterium]
DQLATLVSNGSTLQTPFGGTWADALGQDLLAQNPVLRTDINFFPNSSIALPVVATSGQSGTTLFTTGFLQALAPATDLMSKPNEFAGIPSQQLGVTSNFGIADPAQYYTNTYTGSPQMIKDLTPPTTTWTLTDAASAAAAWGGQSDFALQTPDSVGSATPTYAAPDEASMWAAVSDMSAQPDGTLVPNPRATAVNGVEPYPLTYVEYAIAPTQPLVNADCSPKTQAQQNLVSWLNYITGVGQSELPAGMAPLNPVLQGQAAAAIAKVGQAAPACTTTPTAIPAATTTPSSNGGSGASGASGTSALGSGGSSLGSGSDLSLGSLGAATALGGPAGGSGTGAGTGSTPKKSPEQAAVALSRFTGHPSSSWIGPLIGLLALAVVLPAFVLAASGASLREALAGLGGSRSNRRRRGRLPPPPGPS